MATSDAWNFLDSDKRFSDLKTCYFPAFRALLRNHLKQLTLDRPKNDRILSAWKKFLHTRFDHLKDTSLFFTQVMFPLLVT